MSYHFRFPALLPYSDQLLQGTPLNLEIFLSKKAPNANIKRFDDDATAASAYLSGQVHLLATANVVAHDLSKKYPSKALEPKFIMRYAPCDIGIAHGNPELLNWLNVGTAIKAVAPHVRVIGVEAAGSPVIRRSIDAGHPVALEEVTTEVATMACARTNDRIFDIVKSTIDDIILVDDAQMHAAAEWLWFEIGLAADLSGAAAVAALRQGRINVRPDQRICATICGAGPDIFV